MTTKEKLQKIHEAVLDWSLEISLFGKERDLTDKQIKWIVKNLDKITNALQEVIEDIKL